jgi:hypothetical protein
MLRNHLSPEKGFEWRAREITRLEGFSDAVFAFAVTLLVVSLEVPHTYAELADVMRGFPAFAICFAMLLQVWYEHAKYSRRYGFQDPYTCFLNAVLLFVVLFYVYPLKFLFTLLVGAITHGATFSHAHPVEQIMTDRDVPSLMIIYGLGFAAVFSLFGLMYVNAYRKRATLGLNAIETFRTRQSMIDNFAMSSIGLTSAVLSALLPRGRGGLAGWIYFLIGIYHWISCNWAGNRERKLRQSAEKQVTSSATATP